MQTFIVSFNQKETAKILDSKRLGKQRVEGLQIAECLLVKESRWKNHPAVKMWKGYEPYLIKIYLKEILNEWEARGYKNIKCSDKWKSLSKHIKYSRVKTPKWLNKDFIIAHQSNLIRKNPEYYKKYFKNVLPNLEYIWPR